MNSLHAWRFTSLRSVGFSRAVGFSLALVVACATASAQDAADEALQGPEAGFTQEELQSLAAEANQTAAPLPNAGLNSSLNFLKLLIDGGALMVPIALMSLVVVAISLERLLALRSGRLFPSAVRRGIRRVVEGADPPSPTKLFELAQQYPSAASRILSDVLQKVGRPIPEAETAISDGTQREADFLYGNVRWLTLAAAVTPLIGLLGTVWGMIIAFYNTTQLGSGANKAEFLAEGIYVALVTTLGGLAVAIPAAIFAHYFEGRITKKLASVEIELRRLIPHFEDLEGKARFDLSSRGLLPRKTVDSGAKRNRTPGTPPAPVPPPSPASRP